MSDIDDFAVIGDCRSAALISREGAVEWLCWPRFDSPSLFGALLGGEAGTWDIRPVAPFKSSRRYLPSTNVLETVFVTATGMLRLTDFMPVASETEKREQLYPEHEILRILRCDEGEVEAELIFKPRPGYGIEAFVPRDAGALGVRLETRAGLITLRAEWPLAVAPLDARARVTLRRGEQRSASLSFAHSSMAILPPLSAHAEEALERTVRWWKQWASTMTYAGRWREQMVRSALALKLLVYAPSGAVLAAPTTSLPERIGGALNWDYRFCWLRDASMTVRALLGLGFVREAEAFLSWLLHTTRLTRPRLNVLYDVFGKKPGPERILNHLPGHRGSAPVRIGNAAAQQLQLDIHGEVLDAVSFYVERGGKLDRETRKVLLGFGDWVCRHWSDADEGIWEPRTQRRHHTHSRVLCWVAIDRLIRLHHQGLLPGDRLEIWLRVRDLIRQDIEEHGWSEEAQTYVATWDSSEVDAALLLLPWYGYTDASSPRMRSTYDRIRRDLEVAPGLLLRYRNDISPGEGAFGICGFWAAECAALGAGDLGEAIARIEALLACQNDVGLFAEEMDPLTGEGLGNFPQAFTHIGFINAALTVQQRLEQAGTRTS